MKGIILYTSKYGATKRYADWLAEETGFECIETKKAKINDVIQYDTVVLGGGIYAGGIAGISFLKKNMDKLGGKKVVIFCNGASPYDETLFGKIKARNLKGNMESLPCFYLQGAFDMKSMKFLDRKLCGMLQKSVAKKKPEEMEVWEKALFEAGDSKCDWTDKENLAPVIEALR